MAGGGYGKTEGPGTAGYPPRPGVLGRLFGGGRGARTGATAGPGYAV